MKKISALMLLSATMILASCGAKETPSQESNQPETSQKQAEESSPAKESQPASTPASEPAKESQPASTPASEPEASTMSVTEADFVTEENVNYLKLKGEIAGLTGDAAKFAFGLRHKDATSGGLADELDGQWLVGSEAPAAADYKYAPTIDADGKFEIKISLADVTFVKGAYEIFVGPQGHYAAVDLAQADYGAGSFKANGLKMILRGDVDLIFAEELPMLVLTEETVIIEEEKAILKVGGELGSATADEFLATTIKVTCERQVGGWKKTEMAAEKVTNVVEGTKGYVKIDITDLAEGGYQVKLGFDGTSAPNTVMECDSYDGRTNPTILGNKAYSPYFAEGTNDAEHLYGCCGLFIEHSHTFTRPEEKVGESDLYKLTGCSCTEVRYEVDVVDADESGFHAPAKMKSDATWDVTGIEAGEYEIYIDGHMSGGNGGLDLISNATAGNDSRYAFQAGSNDLEYITNTKTVTELGWEANDSGAYKYTNEAVATIMISDTETTLKMLYKGTGYSIFVEGLRLVKVGSYMAPPAKLIDDTTRIEAENSHANSSSNAGTLTEDTSVSGENYVAGLTATSSWWSTNYGTRSYIVKALADINAKIKIAYKSTGEAGFEVLVDDESKGTLGTAASDTFITVETEAMELAKGKHTITIRGVKNSTVDLDYLEVVKVVEETVTVTE